MFLDIGITTDLSLVPNRVTELATAGFDGVFTAESNRDVFAPLVLAAEHSDLYCYTNIALAFPRSPMLLACTGWDLQNYSQGKMALGLGLFGNPKSVWGGEVITNFHIDPVIGEMLLTSEARKENLGNPNWMLDMIVAPSISTEVLEILGERKERKLYSNPALKEPKIDNSEWSSRPVSGGRL